MHFIHPKQNICLMYFTYCIWIFIILTPRPPHLVSPRFSLVCLCIFLFLCLQGSTESCNTNEEEDMKGRRGTRTFFSLFCMLAALWHSNSYICGPSPRFFCRCSNIKLSEYNRKLLTNQLTSHNSRILLRNQTWVCGDSRGFVGKGRKIMCRFSSF